MIVFDFFDSYARELIDVLAGYFCMDRDELEEFLLKGDVSAYSLIERFNLDLNVPDSKKVSIVCRHMTTSNMDDINSFKKKGALDLRRMLQEDTPLSEFLDRHGVRVNVDKKLISINGKEYPIKSTSEDCTDCYIGADLSCTGYSKCELNKNLSYLYNKLYFYSATLEFFIHGTLSQMKVYSSIGRYPEILYTIGNIMGTCKGCIMSGEKLGYKWQEKNRDCFVVQFNARLDEMETYAPMDYEKAYWEEQELYELMGYDYSTYMSRAIPQNFYNNYYLLKMFCRCFYDSSEQYGSLLPGKIVEPKRISIYDASGDELVEI